MTDQELYNSATGYLLSFENITKEDLEKHFESENFKPDDIQLIYKRLCDSAQNRQMSNKVIGKSIGGIDNLKKVLFDFNPGKVASVYSKNDKFILLDKIIKELNPTGQLRVTNRSIWPQFCQSLIDSAHFLESFNSVNEFYSWANFFATDIRAKPALPLMLSMEITGIGFPLACDFLKEIGYTVYGKPDVHLKEIFKALNFIDPLEKSKNKQDYSTFKVIDRIALANNVSPYKVDKVFWLIGSGKFYRVGKKIGSQRKGFIDLVTKLQSKN